MTHLPTVRFKPCWPAWPAIFGLLSGVLFISALLPGCASDDPSEEDLSVGWISRLPKIDYVWGSTRPDVEGWPAVGQTVTWVAHVRSLGPERLDGVRYRWLLDGQPVTEGTASFDPESSSEFELPWQWTFERHTLAFEIDVAGAVQEIEERNNRLLVYTDALGVGFWVEQSLWDVMRPTLQRAGIGATTFEDWMQLRVRQFNDMAALARYPETPNGVLDRWRIDAIHLVADGALPEVPPGPEVPDWGAEPSSYATIYPNTSDRSIDLQWGFPASSSFLADYDAWQLLNDSLVHELGHARYLVDIYAWNVESDRDVIGLTPRPPSTESGAFHTTGEVGMMNTQWNYIDRYNAAALNRIAGHRATQGHYNEPANIGAFLNDLPLQNRVRLVTPDGTTFPNRLVRIYQASGALDPGWRDHIYRLDFDARSDLQMRTDGQGAILLGRNPFGRGPVVSRVDQANGVAIVEVLDGATSHWGYLESLQFNLAYWRGQTGLAQHELMLDAPVCFNGLGPNEVSPGHRALVTTPQVRFRWPGEAGHQYTVWASVNHGEAQKITETTPQSNGSVSVEATLSAGSVAWWLEEVTDDAPGCPPRRSSIYFFDLQP